MLNDQEGDNVFTVQRTETKESHPTIYEPPNEHAYS